MDKELKEKKLREFASSIIEDPRYKDEIQYCLRHFNLTKEQLIDGYVKYDLDAYDYENEVYESVAMRLVLHLHYLLEGSWHQDRQNAVVDFLGKIDFNTMADVGFGVPTKYLRHYLKESNQKKFTLVDLYESAFEFSKVLLYKFSPEWEKQIFFKKVNMNSMEYVGDHDVYLFQDSIEHTIEPTGYLADTVSSSPKDAKFILSLPIGPAVPSHYIEFREKEAAIKWLDHVGLKVDDSRDIYVKPEVDLFAVDIDVSFFDYFVLCSKKQ